MTRSCQRWRTGLVALGLLSLSLRAPADDDAGPGAARVPLLPRYQQECSACHIAYPPGMLPAAAWKRIMTTLPRHYGADASLDPATVELLLVWLSRTAGPPEPQRQGQAQKTPPGALPEDRITRSVWFINQHRELPVNVWKRPAVKSASNCAACHTQADQGDFNEHSIRIPR